MNKSYKKYCGYIFFGVLFIIYFLITLFLFHRQSVNYGDKYISDMAFYIAGVMGVSTNKLPYPIMFWIAEFFSVFIGPKHAMALTVTGLNALTALILKYYFDRFLQVEKGGLCDFGSTILTFLSLFVSMLFPFDYLGKYHTFAEGFLFRYKGTFSPNPFHNATYLAARPFALIAFFMAVDILQEYESETGKPYRKYIAFSVVLLLATMAKPSFTLVLVSVCGVIMLYRLIKSKMKGFKAFWWFGVTFIPTFLALLYQYQDMFTGGAGGEETGIGFGFLTAWKTATNNVFLAILMGIAFPIGVAVFQRKRIRAEKYLLFAWQFYAAGLISLAFLYEKGHRMEHINFAWGYMYGMFFIYIASLMVLVQETRQKRQAVWQLVIQWSLFAAHLICGADYFRIVVSGELYL